MTLTTTTFNRRFSVREGCERQEQQEQQERLA